MNGAVNIHLQATGAQPTAKDVNAVAGSLNALHGAQTRTTGSNRNLGNALLQTSRGLQDMQYGLAGAVNNLEGIATALGLGAGVAGVVTVLAVAVQQLGPKVIDMLKSFDGAAQVRDSISAMQEQLGKVEPVDAATKAGERYKGQLDAEMTAMKAANELISQRINLLNLESAAQKSRAEFELEQGIQDIQAQRLPKEQELALIAERRIRFAEAEKARQDALAAAQAKAREEALSNSMAVAQSMADELVRIDAMIERTARLNDLKEQQKQLNAEIAKADIAASAAQSAGIADPQTEARAQAARAALAANEAAQAGIVSQGIGDMASLQAQRGAVLPSAQGAISAARAAQMQAEAQAANEQAQARERAAELERERQRIGRGVAPGVFQGSNLQAPALPFGPAPLPTLTPGLTAPINQLPPSPLGIQALPQLDNAANATNAAAQSSNQLGDAVLSFAQTQAEQMEALRKSNAETARKVETLTAQIKNSRVA